MSNRKPEQAWVYPTADQKAQWEAEADKYGVSMSEYIKNMVEAGRKKFDARVRPDEGAAYLREQRNELKDELAKMRTSISRLQRLLDGSDAHEVQHFIQQNPNGVAFEDITQHIKETTPRRVTSHLDRLEGEWVVHDPETDQYYYRNADLPDPDRDLDPNLDPNFDRENRRGRR